MPKARVWMRLHTRGRSAGSAFGPRQTAAFFDGLKKALTARERGDRLV